MALPSNIRKHYINPGRMPQQQEQYDAKTFFNSWYGSVIQREFSDGITIYHEYKPLHVRYHYNIIENAVIKLLDQTIAAGSEPLSVLDIGPGAGHWLQFYLEVFRAKKILGVEISDVAAKALVEKFADKREISIKNADISDSKLDLSQQFDIINAIGVIFHIVDDNCWQQTLKNMAKHLKPDGRIVVGGQFGWLTQNVQFHDKDEFGNWDETVQVSEDRVRVNKRIRSLKYWKRGTKNAGLTLVVRKKNSKRIGGEGPERNLLLLRHR